MFAHDIYCEQISQIHGDAVAVVGRYQNAKVKIEHSCGVCGLNWFASPFNIQRGGACPKRHNMKRTPRVADKWAEAYVEKLRAVHGDAIKLVGTYDKTSTPTLHRCRNGFEWSPRPNDVLKGKGCPCLKCNHSGVSKLSLLWLEVEAKRRRIVIQHAGNRGEFKIPGTKFKVDGYNARRRIVFEFHGDAFHGNPAIYKPNERCHPWKKQFTARQLYTATMAREEELRGLGYTVVSIWESDFLAANRI